MAPGWRACLACSRPSVQSQALHKAEMKANPRVCSMARVSMGVWSLEFAMEVVLPSHHS